MNTKATWKSHGMESARCSDGRTLKFSGGGGRGFDAPLMLRYTDIEGKSLSIRIAKDGDTALPTALCWPTVPKWDPPNDGEAFLTESSSEIQQEILDGLKTLFSFAGKFRFVVDSADVGRIEKT